MQLSNQFLSNNKSINKCQQSKYWSLFAFSPSSWQSSPNVVISSRWSALMIFTTPTPLARRPPNRRERISMSISIAWSTSLRWARTAGAASAGSPNWRTGKSSVVIDPSSFHINSINNIRLWWNQWAGSIRWSGRSCPGLSSTFSGSAASLPPSRTRIFLLTTAALPGPRSA